MTCNEAANSIATSASVSTDSTNGPATERRRHRQRQHRQPQRPQRRRRPDGSAPRHPPPRAPAPARGPSSPCGRTTSTAAITTNTSTSVAFGSSTIPKACSRPISSAARYAPGRLPSPPTTTTTKASVMTDRSICRLADPSGNASAPPSPASPAPSANTVVNSIRWSTPSAATMSRSCVAARTSVPHRVRVNSSHSAPQHQRPDARSGPGHKAGTARPRSPRNRATRAAAAAPDRPAPRSAG